MRGGGKCPIKNCPTPAPYVQPGEAPPQPPACYAFLTPRFTISQSPKQQNHPKRPSLYPQCSLARRRPGPLPTTRTSCVAW